MAYIWYNFAAPWSAKKVWIENSSWFCTGTQFRKDRNKAKILWVLVSALKHVVTTALYKL